MVDTIDDTPVPSLKQYFINRYFNRIDKDTKLQNLIINIQSGNQLKFLQECTTPHDVEIRNKIDSLYKQYRKFLDSNDIKFIKEQKTNNIACIFELIMADLINQRFPLKIHSKNPGSPDFYTNDFFVECTTRISSLMPDWDQLLPYFNDYYDIVNTLLDGNRDGHLCTIIANRWIMLNKDQLTIISDKLNCLPVAAYEKINDWVLLNHYVLCFFKNYIPAEIAYKLEELGIKRVYSGKNNQEDYFSFCLDQIVCCLLDKLEKVYFQTETRGIICISIASLRPALALSENETISLLEYFKNNFFDCLSKNINNRKKNEPKIRKGLNNLVAIILDTNWYNWFGDILSSFGHANFIGSLNNHYCIVFNQDILNNETFDKSTIESKFREVIKHAMEFSFIGGRSINHSPLLPVCM